MSAARSTAPRQVRGSGAWPLLFLGALVISAACERESIDLLSEDGLGGTSPGPASGGTSGSGNPGSGGGFGDAGFGSCTPGTNCFDPPGFECPPNSEYCEECNDTRDCRDGWYCSIFLDHCVECRDDSDCDDNSEERRCDPLTFRCAPDCSEQDLECPEDRPLCDTSRNVCVDCIHPSHCVGTGLGDGPICAAGDCVQCMRHLDCAPPRSFCDEYRCSECRNDGDCPPDHDCNQDSGSCEPA